MNYFSEMMEQFKNIYMVKSPDFFEVSLLNGLRRLDFDVVGLSVNVGVVRPFRELDLVEYVALNDSLSCFVPFKADEEVGVSWSVDMMHCDVNNPM